METFVKTSTPYRRCLPTRLLQQALLPPRNHLNLVRQAIPASAKPTVNSATHKESTMNLAYVACIYADDPECELLCDEYLQDMQGLDDRDDPGANPPLPDDTCVCVYACDQCEAHGAHTADCKLVCEYAELSNEECITLCNAALHIYQP